MQPFPVPTAGEKKPLNATDPRTQTDTEESQESSSRPNFANSTWQSTLDRTKVCRKGTTLGRKVGICKVRIREWRRLYKETACRYVQRFVR